ncbi:MAG: replication-relaxation family protein, partial [Pseudomonadota bacterium]
KPVRPPSAPTGATPPPPKRKIASRGITSKIRPALLQRVFWVRALLILDRFRVVRAIDIAIGCCPERPYKAALTAAQRAMRGMSKAGLVRRYRTDRHQHVYGLTTAGARWLQDQGFNASPSIRRVSDMTNPEHRLWMSTLVLACEARGLAAYSESEALQMLNRGRSKALLQGFLKVEISNRTQVLRPDALAREADGTTWFEIDRSRRGEERGAALSALAERIGATLEDGTALRRVVVFARTERIQQRALAILRDKARWWADQILNPDYGRHYRETAPAEFAVIRAVYAADRRTVEDRCVGHIVVQLLPTWLPKVRLSESNQALLAGWFGENYLPYRRPAALSPWPTPLSPLPGILRQLEPDSDVGP